MKLLFLLALTSRTALMPMVGHWALILAAFLIDAPIDWAADITFIGVVALAVVSVVGLPALNRDGRVSERMSRGPDVLLRHSVAVIGAALASSVGGVLLLLGGEAAAAWWAMGLATVVVGCETSALLGSFFVEALESGRDAEGR